LILFLTSLVAAVAVDLQREFSAMVQAERDFAKTSVEKGRRQAFLTYLSKDSIVFNPGPTSGQANAEKMPEQNFGVLDWYPDYADISSSGDFGYTTGPWRYSDTSEPGSVVYGEFNSIWQKQSDGHWKNICDFGVSFPRSIQFDPQTKLSYIPRKVPKPAGSSPSSAQETLLALERKFSEMAETQGLAAAYEAHLSPDARFYRDNEFPFIGKETIIEYLNEKSLEQKWEPTVAKISSAGDLGYIYGPISTVGKTKEAYYLRVWKKQSEGDWKVVLDVNNVSSK
jgi:ketosteroid isomerase-like protein